MYFNIAGTLTGRLRSSGINLQNMPRPKAEPLQSGDVVQRYTGDIGRVEIVQSGHAYVVWLPNVSRTYGKWYPRWELKKIDVVEALAALAQLEGGNGAIV